MDYKEKIDNNAENSPRLHRLQRIKYLYRFFLLKIDKNVAKQEVIDNFQIIFKNEIEINSMLNLIDNIDELVEKIIKQLKGDWSWERINPIKKAILINGAYEILMLEIPRAITTNEAMEIARIYIPGEDIKFINGCLDNL
ncbi:transcription antitermination factor NusB [Spiroplasma endosymbiont of Labia minor]|uniref:transcription antitermination factor NusB n=1 Tax=Spiroplasma endosymbiont of Labia minor TaxID=3066305 RepID=UPI0030D45F16